MGDKDSTTGEQDKQFSCLYFGFASNLAPRTIKQRCSSALYVGVGVIKGWKFVISDMGFGNIVPGAEDDIVYGSLIFLSKRDEEAMDSAEEVPQWHQKMNLKATRLVDPSNVTQGQDIEVMTYVDVKRTGEGIMSKEYIPFMRKAIAEGLQIGVPASYFDKYMKRFLPEDETVGRVDQMTMVRTLQMDKNNTQYVPSNMLRSGRQQDA